MLLFFQNLKSSFFAILERIEKSSKFRDPSFFRKSENTFFFIAKNVLGGLGEWLRCGPNAPSLVGWHKLVHNARPNKLTRLSEHAGASCTNQAVALQEHLEHPLRRLPDAREQRCVYVHKRVHSSVGSKQQCQPRTACRHVWACVRSEEVG